MAKKNKKGKLASSYVIHNKGEGGEKLWWCNKQGWVSPQSEADHYTKWEKGTVDLPIGGAWEKVTDRRQQDEEAVRMAVREALVRWFDLLDPSEFKDVGHNKIEAPLLEQGVYRVTVKKIRSLP